MRTATQGSSAINLPCFLNVTLNTSVIQVKPELSPVFSCQLQSAEIRISQTCGQILGHSVAVTCPRFITCGDGSAKFHCTAGRKEMTDVPSRCHTEQTQLGASRKNGEGNGRERVEGPSRDS